MLEPGYSYKMQDERINRFPINRTRAIIESGNANLIFLNLKDEKMKSINAITIRIVGMISQIRASALSENEGLLLGDESKIKIIPKIFIKNNNTIRKYFKAFGILPYSTKNPPIIIGGNR